MNIIIIKGRLAADPEMQTLPSGQALCKIRVAVNRKMQKDKVDWINCSAFGKIAEIINQYFNKGKEIVIQGRLESYQHDNDGKNRTEWQITVDNVEFCGGNDGAARTQYNTTQTPATYTPQQTPAANDSQFDFNQIDNFLKNITPADFAPINQNTPSQN